MNSSSQQIDLLYREHRDWLFAWLRRNLHCPQRAEDLSQDTFMRLLSRGDSQPLREPRALLTTIARGLLIDHFRRSALERAYLKELALLPEQEQPAPGQQPLALRTLQQIDQLLDGLSANARDAFLFNRLDGLDHAEIAERLGVSVSRVRQYLVQGLRQCYIAMHGEPL